MESLAKSSGWETNQTQLSKLCGEKQENVSRYISLLINTGLLYKLCGYRKYKERAYRQAKYFWFDSGSACLLSGIYSKKDLEQKVLKGRYFENFVLQQIMSWTSTQIIKPDIFYWKLKPEDVEVDFILRSRHSVLGIEVKSTDVITYKHTKSLQKFLKTHSESKKGIIVYKGNKIFQVASNIYAVPWYML